MEKRLVKCHRPTPENRYDPRNIDNHIRELQNFAHKLLFKGGTNGWVSHGNGDKLAAQELAYERARLDLTDAIFKRVEELCRLHYGKK